MKEQDMQAPQKGSDDVEEARGECGMGGTLL
jgi:hypothetical protein